MNDSPEELVSTGKLGAGMPSDNGLSSAQSSAEKQSNAARQNAVQAAHPFAVNNSKSSISVYDYAGIEADFRSHHHTNAAQRRGPYEHYRLVYRYGYDLGTDPRYRDADWSAVELAARPRWEERNPGTWEQFEEMIRYAWDTARCPHGSGRTTQ
jgi:hypothetical protein